MDVLCQFPMPATHPGSNRLTRACRRSGFQFLIRRFNVVIIKESSFGAVKSRSPFVGIRAAAAVEVPDVRVDSDVDTTVDVLACPICYKPLIRKGPSGLNMSSVSRSGFQCEICKKAYSSRDVYLDLTVTAGSSEYEEYRPLRTELFRSPLVSFVYERGWRQNFGRRGFPGPDEEFKMAQKYLEPAAGGLLVDASCGSGLFSRRFAKCGIYSGNLALVRADISRLPFTTGSVDAVHAGAALHCWPSPSTAVAEISRVLRPGGVFVATTFVLSGILDLDIAKPLRQAVQQATNAYNYLTERELKDLCKTCGLVDYSCIRRQAFVMISARKPE